MTGDGIASTSKYRKTLTACYLGFVTQAIVANFTPLLFLRFHTEYNIPLGKIALISTVFYILQILIDVFCAKFVDAIGYRKSVVFSQILSSVGLVGLAFLPSLFGDPFVGILISVVVYAVGSGLIEVLVSPIVEACPFENKDSVMSLLHSFYCWGVVGVVALSTLFFAVFGMEHWRIMACLWALRAEELTSVVGMLATRIPGLGNKPKSGGTASPNGKLEQSTAENGDQE